MKVVSSALLVMGVAQAAKVTPVQKVIQLLEGMHQQGVEEKESEAVKFSAYSQWCDNITAQKKKAIAKQTALIEKLTADILKAEADAQAAHEEIVELSDDISRWKSDNKAARDIRVKEAADFAATNQDYAETLDALDRAISTLKKQSYDRKQAADLMQTLSLIQSNTKLTRGTLRASQRALNKFLQEPASSSEFFERKAPEANAYEFQSGGIVEMMEQLKDKFAKEKSDLEKEEVNAKYAFEQLGQTLADNIENASAVIERRTNYMNERLQNKAEAEGEKAATEADKKADSKYLSDLTTQCSLKSDAFDSRQKLREEELDAISQAIEILGSSAVSGSADKHLPALLQIKSSFLQVKTKLSRYNPSSNAREAQEEVATLLSNNAAKYNSQLLSMLATRVQADPFKKVKKMIREMISKLMEEATAETEHHGWCQAELGANKETRNAKTASVEDLTATLEQLTAEVAKLTEEVAELSAEVAELDKDRKEATEVRTAENKKNLATIADAKAAQEAVTNALTILQEFYAKAGKATDLLQTKQSPEEDAPETFTEPYKGMGGESGGVVGLLEVIQTDFARLESETTANEEQASEEYTQFMNDSEVDKAVKSTDIEHKKGLITKKNSASTETKKELKTTQEELDAANAYYEKLKPSCVDTGMTYEERVARREDEMQSLKEAMEILKGVDVE